jgi:hypothetical protein
MTTNTPSLIRRLQTDLPNITFKPAREFSWSATKGIVTYNDQANNWQQLLLHEVAHSLLKHQDYRSDRELVKLEADAWGYAKEHLAAQYQVVFDNDLIEDHKDSYREWLFRRSRCPRCEYGGWQTGPNQYKCPNCLSSWHVNSNQFRRVVRTLDKK